MAASRSLHKSKRIYCLILFIAFSAFTADVVDLREELRFLSSLYNSLDSNIASGLTSATAISPEPALLPCSVQERVSIEITFMHLLPYDFRAPPTLS